LGKTKIGNNAFVYPMPMVLVGAVVEGRANFMPVGWISRVNARPPMIAIALGPRHTKHGIYEHGQFSVNVPGLDMLEVVDYCGLVSGRDQDKSGLFELFCGELEYAPMIRQCPLTVECKLARAVDLPTHTLFIGELAGVYVDEECLTNGRPDIQRIEPFTLTMPDNNYWAVGRHAGKAWGSGKSFSPQDK
jgi:flavin reductase (DIM6/NTAB) family NADH-FMN oxidoreductase RutF